MRIVTPFPPRGALVAGIALASLWATGAWAVNINFVSGAVGRDIEVLRELVTVSYTHLTLPTILLV